MLTGQTFLFASLGGILPALLWLWYWLKEDKARPEPKGLILLSFVAGMVTVPLVIPLEQIAIEYSSGLIMVILWAAIEELMKYGAAFFVVLRRKAVDEPIDAIIYMITIALGFAALENTLFLLNPSLSLENVFITGNLRFVGATLLHTLASASVGVAMALSFYKKKAIKKSYVIVGIILSIILHSLFNFFIINTDGEKILTVFAFVWVGIVLLLLSFEKVKNITRLRMRN